MLPEFDPTEGAQIVSGIRQAIKVGDRLCLTRGVLLLGAYGLQLAHNHEGPTDHVFGDPVDAGGPHRDFLIQLESLAVEVDPDFEIPMATSGGIAKNLLFQAVLKLLWKKFVDPDAEDLPQWLKDIIEALS